MLPADRNGSIVLNFGAIHRPCWEPRAVVLKISCLVSNSGVSDAIAWRICPSSSGYGGRAIGSQVGYGYNYTQVPAQLGTDSFK